VALFAGGFEGDCSFALCDGGVVPEMLSVEDAWLRFFFCCCFVVYAVRRVAV
jgi:hypothetical protein